MTAAGLHSVLDPHGLDAAVIAEIGWVLFAGGAAILVGVTALAAYAVLGRRERTARLSQRALIVGGGIVFPTIVLGALMVYSLVRAASLYAAAAEAPAVRIEVTGHQWWWRVHYLDAAGNRDFATANEIRIPAGRPVEVRLASADVIHSFWVPALAGKLDMIPGRTNRLHLNARRPGEYRGQCAEYCGGPHGLMALVVIAEPEERFAQWLRAQRLPAAHGGGRGAQLFAAQCAACHTVRGTAAAGTLGPDLTHVGSRRTLGAGVLANDAGALAAWIATNQHLKPGNLMPEFRALPAGDLRALAAYLEGLR